MVIFSPQLNWPLSIRPPDFAAIFHSEYMTIVLPLKNVPLQIINAIIIRDLLAALSRLEKPPKI